MRDRLKHLFEVGVISGMRIWGAAAILLSSFGILFCVGLFVAAFLAPSSERISLLLQSVGFGFICALFLYFGVRMISINKRKLQLETEKLSERREQLEAWINK
jgi:hypothetical protein